MKYLGLLLGILLAGCASIPPEVVTSAETLKRYANKLGEGQVQVMDRYQQRLSSVNVRLANTSRIYVNEYEKDVSTLNKQVDELTQAYDLLAAALTQVLEADSNLTRANLISTSEADHLRRMLQAELERRAQRNRTRAEIVDSSGFNDARRRLQETQDQIQTQSADVHKQLSDRLKKEYAEFNTGFDDLIAYLRSLVKVQDERKRVLGVLENRAESLAKDINESKTFNQLNEVLSLFNRGE